MARGKKQIKISRLFKRFAAMFLILGAGLLVFGILQVRNLAGMQAITEDYLAGQEAISSMRDASDFLTEKSRSFTVSGNTESARDFFKEVNDTKRREKALKTIDEIATGKEETKLAEQLADAASESNRLAEIETYAMRLAAEGHGTDREFIDEFFSDVVLSEEDLALSAAEQVEKARGMVFDERYEKLKTSVLDNVAKSTEKLTEKTKARQADSYQTTARYTRFEYLLTVIMLGVIFAMMIMNSLLVVSPIRRGTDYIKNNEKLPVDGAQEYTYLAEAYNSMLEKTEKQTRDLSYEATHDAVTGIYNRKMFDIRREELDGRDVALLLIDIDLFKGVNDKHGHQTGDLVLKTVAGILQTCFRTEDYVCRIGGDEFAVLMVSMKPELEHVVRDKIAQLQSKLVEEDSIPEVTLSIGVAYSQEGDPEKDIFRKADQALYKAKENGRNGFVFYNELS